MWVPDVVTDASFSRAEAAGKAGFRAAFSFPILADAEFLGVMEFFSGHIQGSSASAVELMTATGPQIGQFVKRKRTEAALLASEARYRLLFDSNPHPMWVVDSATWRFLAVNDAAVQHYGYSRKEFLGMTAVDIRPPEDVEMFSQSMVTPREGVRLTVGWRHRRKDGTVIDVEVSSHAIVFGDRDALLVLVTDVSERRRAETALRESEERFRQLAEHVTQAFFVVDLAVGVPLYVSPIWAEIWGRRLEERLDPKIWLDAIHPDDRANVSGSSPANMP